VADLLQFKRLTSATITQTFTVDGSPLDLDSGVPVVTITRPDGTTIPSGTVSNSWAGPPARSTGQYRFVLAGQPNETLLTVTWTGTIGGQSQTLQNTIEVVGADLFTISALRAMKVSGGTPFSSSVTWPDTVLADTRAEVLEEFTDILGFSPVPRFHRQVCSVGYGGQVILDGLLAHRVLSVSVAGVAQVAANYFVAPGGVLLPVSSYAAAPWAHSGYGNVVVEYVAGWDRVKGDGSDVAMLRAAMKLIPGLGSTANQVTTPDGASYSFDPAGQVTRAGNVRHYGVPAIDAWLNRHSMGGVAVA
jgi:hypothetical protein